VRASIFSLEDESFTNVEAVTAGDVIAQAMNAAADLVFSIVDQKRTSTNHIHPDTGPGEFCVISISTRLCVQNMTDLRTFCRSNRTFATRNRISHSSFHRILRIEKSWQ
jgi:hypothetical protein